MIRLLYFAMQYSPYVTFALIKLFHAISLTLEGILYAQLIEICLLNAVVCALSV